MATTATIAGVILLTVNSVVIDDPGPGSALPRAYLATWPAGLVLLGVGMLGVVAACLVESMRDHCRGWPVPDRRRGADDND
ncbi:hypothetical protein [Microbacterium testaceum]|uniref:hypothetical protein n=1 Tax=Microbacterium testaceum TaxID=2033 RepID=UPI0011D235D1|nr:hypothetical protein [Microbacterium testaceum]